MRPPDPPASFPEPSRRTLDVPVTALDARGRSSRPGLVVGGLVAIAIGAALVSGQLFPVVPAASLRPTGIANATLPAGSPGPVPTDGPPQTPQPAPIATRPWPALAADVRRGALDGTIVLLTGTLDVHRVTCRGGVGICPELSIHGPDLPVVAAPGLLPWDRDPPAGATLVLVIGFGEVTFLGAIPADVSGPVSITDLLDSRRRPLALTDLFPVRGTLLAHGPACNSLPGSSSETPVPCDTTPVLADPSDGSTAPDGTTQNAPVSLTTWFIGQRYRSPIEATFLVRRVHRPECPAPAPLAGIPCDELMVMRPEVVALLDASTAVRATVP